ncbi:YbfB/YjiJ family MFS transporter [Amphritea balenae]|uniref:YbfB/YjiJ family MFS transporter n=1 Tax=Amphritea balenae TaxID=452629 RepID=A0A3P1SVX6_9GAMM|nr:YbfB/YjiJ family MFS transporter [Amphritea balenae]RRD01362.1 YbfB/YjiJ family MFS transporter [Amphritea balenae]GGK57759.1 MFS transporter [Amphritea balenae]
MNSANSDNTQHLKVLGSGLLGLILTIGIARFCYTTLLPAMQIQAGLSDLAGGYLATINYIGYMCGALLAATVGNLKTKDFLYRAGLITAVITTAAMALSDNIWFWAVLRFFSGLSSASGMLISAGLIMNWLIRHGHRTELGIHYAGAGLGIIVSGIAAELMIGHLDWREQWLAVGLLGSLIAIPAWRWLPRPENGLQTASGQQLKDNPPSRRWMLLLGAMYFCAGYAYVVSATFLVAIVEAQPGLQGDGQIVWIFVGLSATPAVILWDRVARKLGELNALLIAFLIQIVGIILPALNDNFWVVLTSAVLYGGSFIAIVSLVLAMAGRFYPTKPAKLMGKLTLLYGIAQIGAPAIAGIIADNGGSYADSLYIAAAISVLGAIMILVMQATKRRELALTQN